MSQDKKGKEILVEASKLLLEKARSYESMQMAILALILVELRDIKKVLGAKRPGNVDAQITSGVANSELGSTTPINSTGKSIFVGPCPECCGTKRRRSIEVCPSCKGTGVAQPQ